ncbi:hypothetical protein ACT79_10880 [Burkholderia pseudomallei]|nr:hypothetical protein ACT79_10880 [Burkholderia pseudomallei]
MSSDEARSGIFVHRTLHPRELSERIDSHCGAGVPARENKPAIACDAGDQKIDRPVSVVNCSSA